MENLRDFVVELEQSGQRVDAFLAKFIAEISRTKIKELIESGLVKVNGHIVKPKQSLVTGDKVEFRIPKTIARKSTLEPIAMNLDIIFEDKDLIVVNKPVGLVVHPGSGTQDPTLVHGLLAHCQELADSFGKEIGENRPGIVHRLDKDTSGVMLCAKNEVTHNALAAQFKAKTNKREYFGLVLGVPALKKFTVRSYLARHPTQRTKFMGHTEEAVSLRPSSNQKYRLAVSDVCVDKIYAHRLSLCRIQLQTGRTHQIRVHLSEHGNPVVGDLVYGRTAKLPTTFTSNVRDAIEQQKTQLLHAHLLGFVHPTTGQYQEFRADFPAGFQHILDLLQTYEI